MERTVFFQRRAAMQLISWNSVCFLSVLCAACSLPPPLPIVMVQRNPDGTKTRQVTAGRVERQADIEQRLLTSIECPIYEIVAVGQSAQPPPATFYWIRYRCLGDS